MQRRLHPAALRRTVADPSSCYYRPAFAIPRCVYVCLRVHHKEGCSSLVGPRRRIQAEEIYDKLTWNIICGGESEMEAQRSRVFDRPSMDDAEDPKQQIQRLQASVEQLTRRCRSLEASVERKKVVIEDLRTHVTLLEELFSRNQSDMAYAQQQLEFVVISLERQHGIVTDHTEQLRLFAGESTQRGRGAAEGPSQRSVLLLVGNWLYTPVVHFAKGMYSLISPVINTAQSLSLLNSDVLQRNAAGRVRWGATQKGDLLGMLQRGVLDPDAAAPRK